MYQIKMDDQTDEDILLHKVSDEELERTAEMGSSGAFTLGNCTGLGSCPA
jgi:hypothetical protein